MINIYSDGATVGENGKLGTVEKVGLGIYFKELNYGDGCIKDGISNNEAEFKALIWAMKTAIEKNILDAAFHLDSQIVVNRANGRRPKKKKHKNKRMDAFQDKVLELSKHFHYIKFVWIPREYNERADYYSKKWVNKTMKPQTKIKKGKLLENYLADQIVAKGLDDRARREPSSGAGNREKSDTLTNLMIANRNIGFECKNQKTISIPAWWRQVTKLEKLNQEPVLVFKLPRHSLDDSLVTLRLDTFLDLLKYQQDSGDIEDTIAITSYEKGQLYRALDYMIPILRKIKSIVDPRK